MLTLRCSALPLLFKCPSSHAECEHPVRYDNRMAELGRRVHAALALVVKGDFAPGETPVMADDEAQGLVDYGTTAWGKLKGLFVKPFAEEVVTFCGPAWDLKGHADIVEIDTHADNSPVVDWKTGWKDSDYTPQMIGYGLADAGTRKAIIVWLRFREYEVIDLPTPEEAIALISEKVSQIGKQYAPGEHCGWCPRVHECEARTEWLHTAAVALKPWSDRDRAVVRSDLPRLHEQAVALQKALDAFREVEKMEVETGGPLEFPDGSRLEFQETVRKTIEANEGWPLILDALGEDQKALAGVISVKKGALEKKVKALADKGQKTKDWMRLLDALDLAGAIRETPIRKLVKVRGEVAE